MEITSVIVNRVCVAMAVAGFMCAAQDVNATPAEKPNIVLILSDDHRWDALGLAGNSSIKTPNLDQLAKEGQWYREATIQVPICTSSRAAILTGLPPYRNGWYSNSRQRRDIIRSEGLLQYKLLPRQFQKAGYLTAFTGKWHLVPEPWKFGFETVKHWMLGGAGRYKNPKLADGKTTAVKDRVGFTQTIFADDTIEILESHANSETTQPLFLWTAFTAPHLPFKPNPEPFNNMYDGKSPRELAPATFYSDPTKTRNAESSWQKYYEAISALDADIGRIMNTIRNSSLSTNTLVVFIGDNGFMMGSRGLWGKSVPYDDSIRVPLIVWGPDTIVGARGTTVTASVNSIDLPPTLIKLAGGVPPEEWTGRDVSAVIKDGQPHDITWAAASYSDHENNGAYRLIRTPEDKLIKFHPDSGKKPELYDLKADPGEKNNVYGLPASAAIQEKLEKQLTAYRAETGDSSWDMTGPVDSFKKARPKKAKPGSVAKKRKSANQEKRKRSNRRKQQQPQQ